jgi:hypothetical protein
VGQAIEQKQAEEQNVQKEEFVRPQAMEKGETPLALAEGQAKANKLLRESLKSSPEMLQMKARDKWDEKLPTFMGSGSVPKARKPAKGPPSRSAYAAGVRSICCVTQISLSRGHSAPMKVTNLG